MDMNEFNRQVIEEFRANEGRVGGQFEGAPMILLTTTGAKSGEKRLQPLVYFEFDGRRFIVASKAGAPTHPAWYHNLVANPTVTAEIGTESYEATATPLPDEERDVLYAKIVEAMPGFGEYQEKTTRKIPIVELVRA